MAGEVPHHPIVLQDDHFLTSPGNSRETLESDCRGKVVRRYPFVDFTSALRLRSGNLLLGYREQRLLEIDRTGRPCREILLDMKPCASGHAWRWCNSVSMVRSFRTSLRSHSTLRC